MASSDPVCGSMCSYKKNKTQVTGTFEEEAMTIHYFFWLTKAYLEKFFWL